MIRSARVGAAIKMTFFHLLLSFLVALILAVLIFAIWFPSPYAEIAGGYGLFMLLIGVDVVCGPLLTLVVFSPSKSKKILMKDLACIVFLQIAVLSYGLHTLTLARPVALVFEIDRFRVVTFADIDEEDIANLPLWANLLSFESIRPVGLRRSANMEEMMASVDASLQGVEPSQRPSWWQDYALSAPEILKRAHPLEVLEKKNPERLFVLKEALQKIQISAKSEVERKSKERALLWLPLVSRRGTDWVLFIDPDNANVVGFASLNAW